MGSRQPRLRSWDSNEESSEGEEEFDAEAASSPGAAAPSHTIAPTNDLEGLVRRASDAGAAPWALHPCKRMAVGQALQIRAVKGSPRALNVGLSSCYLPDTACRPVAQLPQSLFCGKWSTSGNLFLSACQDAVIRLYRAADIDQWSSGPRRGSCSSSAGAGARSDAGEAPSEPPVRSAYGRRLRASAAAASPFEGPKRFKQIRCRDVSWSVISTDFSGDEKWLAYSSWSPYVHLCNTSGSFEMHEALNFRPANQSHFCLFSIQFSPRNTHIAGGGSDNGVYLMDLERKEVAVRARAHQNDVNAVTFVDDSGHVLLSGSDDCCIKAWDTRVMTTAVGCLVGHRGGITCLSSRHDGRYAISNGKDQVLKLWDLRGMVSAGDKSVRAATSQRAGDYRWMEPDVAGAQRPTGFKDVSVGDFTGHRVLQTLIRCYFSPEHTTGQRYIISGSHDGRVRIWDSVTGGVVRQLAYHREIVRDVAWHPFLPLVTSSSWDGRIGLFRYGAASE